MSGDSVNAPFAFEELGRPGRPGLILYDGDCVICSRWFHFVARRDTGRRFFFTPIQSERGQALARKLGIDPMNPATNAVLLDGAVHLRSASALAALRELPHWRWTRIFFAVPRPVRDSVYGVIARNRIRWFGRTTVCDMGGAAYRDRVIV